MLNKQDSLENSQYWGKVKFNTISLSAGESKGWGSRFFYCSALPPSISLPNLSKLSSFPDKDATCQIGQHRHFWGEGFGRMNITIFKFRLLYNYLRMPI